MMTTNHYLRAKGALALRGQGRGDSALFFSSPMREREKRGRRWANGNLCEKGGGEKRLNKRCTSIPRQADTQEGENRRTTYAKPTRSCKGKKGRHGPARFPSRARHFPRNTGGIKLDYTLPSAGKKGKRGSHPFGPHIAHGEKGKEKSGPR